MKSSKQWSRLRIISYVVTCIFLISLIPIFWIGKYNYPCLDDFSVGMAARQVWVNSHSLFKTIMEAFRETGRLYMSWAGTFSTVFLMALCPAVFSVNIYWIVPYLLVGLLSISMWFFIYTLLRYRMQADKYLANVITILVLLFTIQNMPSAVEGFYWYTGAIHYLFPYSFLFLFGGHLLRYDISKSWSKPFKIIIMSVLGIVIGGGNYMTALEACIICFGVVCKWLFMKERKNRILMIPIIFLYIAFFLNVFAPGNLVRQSGTGGLSPIKAILMSFYDCFYTILDLSLSWKALCFILLLLPFIWILVKKTNFSFKYPIIVIIGSYCLMSSVYTPCLYGVGNVSSGRLQDTIYITYVTLFLINMIYSLGWLNKKFSKNHLECTGNLTKKGMLFFAGAVLLTFVSSSLFIMRNSDYYVASSAIHALVSGQALQYGKENQERLTILLDDQQKDIKLVPYTNPPSLLFIEDISEDQNDWKNKALSGFYNKTSAVLVK